MKTLLAAIALAIAMLFASEAFAMPYCTGGTYKDGHFAILRDRHEAMSISASGRAVTLVTGQWLTRSRHRG